LTGSPDPPSGQGRRHHWAWPLAATTPKTNARPTTGDSWQVCVIVTAAGVISWFYGVLCLFTASLLACLPEKGTILTHLAATSCSCAGASDTKATGQGFVVRASLPYPDRTVLQDGTGNSTT